MTKRWILLQVEDYILKRAKPRLKDYGFDTFESFLLWCLNTLAKGERDAETDSTPEKLD